jgi:hypothetical protein
VSSPEYWSVPCPPIPISGKLTFKLGYQLQFQCDLERNAFRNLTLASKENLWKCVERVQNIVENGNSVLSHFRPKAERGHSNIQPII